MDASVTNCLSSSPSAVNNLDASLSAKYLDISSNYFGALSSVINNLDPSAAAVRGQPAKKS